MHEFFDAIRSVETYWTVRNIPPTPNRRGR